MLLLAFDFFLVCCLVLAVAFSLNKFIKLGNKSEIEAALAQQEESAKLAALAAKINPEEINNNKAKVKETLDKLS